jgi:hypothetical protein
LFRIPDGVKDDIFEIRIFVVAMCAPAGSAQIYFHIASVWNVITDLQNRAAKIRAAFNTGEAGMKNANGFPIRGFQGIAPEPLMLPDCLQQTFGRYAVFVAQTIGRADLGTPLRVKIFGWPDHLTLLLRAASRKVKTHPLNRNCPGTGVFVSKAGIFIGRERDFR